MLVTNETKPMQNQLSFSDREKELQEIAKVQREAEEALRKSPFSHWMQLNLNMGKELRWLMRTNPKAYIVLQFMFEQMDGYNALIASYQVFQEALNMSSATVARAIKVLKEHNFVQVLKSGTSNVYTVNKTIAWKSWGNNYKYCDFDAKIILTEAEQEKREMVWKEQQPRPLATVNQDGEIVR